MLADADLHMGRQEDYSHFDADASGVILQKFSSVCTAQHVAGVYLLRDLHTERRVVIFVLVRCLSYRTYVRIPLSSEI